jgi:hypothetical protein
VNLDLVEFFGSQMGTSWNMNMLFPIFVHFTKLRVLEAAICLFCFCLDQETHHEFGAGISFIYSADWTLFAALS